MAVHLLYLSRVHGGRLSAPKDLPFDLGTSESTTVPCLFDIPFEPSHVRSPYIVANGEYEIQFFHFQFLILVRFISHSDYLCNHSISVAVW